jgi:hypothetical protein
MRRTPFSVNRALVVDDGFAIVRVDAYSRPQYVMFGLPRHAGERFPALIGLVIDLVYLVKHSRLRVR